MDFCVTSRATALCSGVFQVGFGVGADFGVGIVCGRVQQAEPDEDAERAFDDLVNVGFGQEMVGRAEERWRR